MAHPTELLHENRFHRRWQLLLLVLVGVTSLFAFAPGQPDAVQIDGLDKLQHLLAFGSMATAGMLSVPTRLRAMWAMAAWLLAFGGLIELVQTQIPHRDASWADLLADAMGIGGGMLLTALLRRIWPARTAA